MTTITKKKSYTENDIRLFSLTNLITDHYLLSVSGFYSSYKMPTITI